MNTQTMVKRKYVLVLVEANMLQVAGGGLPAWKFGSGMPEIIFKSNLVKSFILNIKTNPFSSTLNT
jgi:hypothetical protein